MRNGNAVELKKFVGQLILYFNNEQINEAIQKVSYKRESLINIFKRHYSVVGKKFKAPKSKEKIKFKFGALIGMTRTGLDFSNPDVISYVSNLELDDSYNLCLGLYADMILPKGSKRWSIYSDLTFTKMDYEGRYYSINTEHYYRYYDTELSYSYLRLTNMLRYKIPIGKSQIFVNAGISNSLVLKKTNSAFSTQKQYSTDKVRSGDAFNDRNMEQGIVAGIGLKRNKFQIEYRFENTNGMVDLMMQESKVNRMYILVGYQF